MNLSIKNVPDEVYEQIKKTAVEQRRSLNAQIVHLLATEAAANAGFEERAGTLCRSTTPDVEQRTVAPHRPGALMSALRHVVVDSSVVLKWVLPEAGRSKALALLDEYEAGQTDLIAPG